MEDSFYIRFENRFRGDQSLIKERVSVYLKILEPLKKVYPEAPVIDCGCGRGEWLELLVENGWNAKGIDFNSAMVDECRQKGLDVSAGDAIAYLIEQGSNSAAVVSGFHIAEHLEFNDLLRLVKEALRVLKPGGLLILETPNPENIIVSSCNFYVDPTHRNPLPPQLMGFIADDAGFSKSIIMRLNGPDKPDKDAPLANQVSWFFSANPDYGLVAQKEVDTHSEILENSLNLIEVDNTGAINRVIDSLSAFENALQSQHNALQSQHNALQSQHNALQSQHNALQSQHNNLDLRYNSLVNSYSWKITAPLRWGLNIAKKVFNKIKKITKALVLLPRKVLRSGIILTGSFILKIEFISRPLKKILKKYPGLYYKLFSIIKNRNQILLESQYVNDAGLSPGARRIYEDLKREIEEKKNSQKGKVES